MNRSSHSLVVALAAGLFPFLVFWDGFPMLPVLAGCITAASALLGHHCLVSQRHPGCPSCARGYTAALVPGTWHPVSDQRCPGPPGVSSVEHPSV